VALYTSSGKTNTGKEPSVHTTAAIGNKPSGDFKIGNRIFLDFGEDNAWSGCYRIEDERSLPEGKKIGIFVGSKQEDAEKAERELGKYPKADLWVL
jgi:3D (Asp-Asp-Asp) domain-containing protein